MKNFIKDHRFVAGLLSIFISVFLVSIVAYGATTIGTDIETAGTVTMESASTTNDFWLGNVIADDDDYLYMDASSSEYMMWDDDPGQFQLSDDLKVTGVTTSTLAFWAGSGGTVDHLDMTGGDLYVQDDVEIDGLATSTEGFYSMGVLEIGGNGLIRGKATTTTAFAVGAGTIDNLDMAGGDLYVLDDFEVDGNAFVTGYASSTISLNTQGTGHIGSTLGVDGEITGLAGITLSTFASSTTALNTQGTAHVGGNVTIDGMTTTTDYIYLPMVHFQQSVATSADPNIGECFMPYNDLTCYDGADWQYAW